MHTDPVGCVASRPLPRPTSRRHATPGPRVGAIVGTSTWLTTIVCGLTLLGCSKSPADELAAQSIAHLRAAVEMLEANAPDISKLATASMQYRVKHHGAFEKLRTDGERLLAAMSPAERTAFESRQRSEAILLYGQLEATAKRYKDERLAMRLVRPLMVTATAKPPARSDGDPPWLPPIVEPPEGASATAAPDVPGAGMPQQP